MLKLAETKSPAPVKLGGGAVVHARAASSVDVITAQNEATRMMVAAQDGQAITELMGFALTIDGPDLTDRAVRAGWVEFITEVLLAEQCITAWEGIADSNGEPLDVSRPAIALLMRDSTCRQAIMARIQTRLVVLEDEAKKLRPAVAGKPVAAGNTAKAAQP